MPVAGSRNDSSTPMPKLVAAEIHGGIGLYRLAVKWGDLAASRARLRRARQAFSAFFIALGLVTLAAYIDLGRAHADRAGERYTPPATTEAR